MADVPRFTDAKDGTIQDTRTGLTWCREDSWQSEAKWVTWDEAIEHARRQCDLKLGGYNDWRLPTREEALTLLVPEASNKDKYGSDIQLPSVFPEGSLPTTWTQEGITGNDSYILDFRNGEVRSLFKSKTGRMAVRPVRGKWIPDSKNSDLP
ncbi:MAG: hypothetical protein COV67_12370 [Nitrospinae bacterium CG11_big_fil_rev_8_21_14_0_20_56_8]|nr:MAG: hypothetical protein COV67_12370 [Nitrospinae bacterium CG11_big_fil_rev_8_21_14_0_20_56_8]